MKLSAADRAFIERLGAHEVSSAESKVLLEAWRHGRVDNARLRSLLGLDTLGASKLLRGLRGRSLLDDHDRGSATWYSVGPALEGQELGPEGQERAPESQERGPESQELGPESQERAPESQERVSEGREPSGPRRGLDPAHEVPLALRREIAGLGRRPGASHIRRVIRRLCEVVPRDTATLAAILRRNPDALSRHIRAMVAEGTLRPTFPDNPTHPKQAYATTQMGLLDSEEP